MPMPLPAFDHKDYQALFFPMMLAYIIRGHSTTDAMNAAHNETLRIFAEYEAVGATVKAKLEGAGAI